MRTRIFWLAAMVGAAALNGSCGGKADEQLTQRLLDSTNKVLACQKDLSDAKAEIGSLKKQLAEAMLNPAHVQLTDPEVIELVASRRGPAPANTGGGEVQPTLDPKEASTIVMRGAPGMQACYERALKKNAGLQTRSGIGVTLGITVRPNGLVSSVDIAPDVDREMTACFRSTASRWKFPTFTGTAVTIEQKITLTPKT
jgi:hypothetical protein